MRRAAWGREVMLAPYRQINGHTTELLALNRVMSGQGIKLTKSLTLGLSRDSEVNRVAKT